jgi:L-ascorbate metabolism protein UlaG (beta-lactamase superfamily)
MLAALGATIGCITGRVSPAGAARAEPAGLPRPVAAGDAAIRYLGTSGWAVRTRDAVLLFDYVGLDGGFDRAADSAWAPSVASLRSAIGSGARVYLFTSHQHRDHFSPALLRWADSLPAAHVVIGGPITDRAAMDATPLRSVVMGEGERVNIAGADIATIQSTDEGVGFVVRVDGVTLFHAGDHALWAPQVDTAYWTGIGKAGGLVDSVTNTPMAIDLAFLPIATGSRCEPRASLRAGALGAIAALQPKAAFPMHVRCLDRLALYAQFADSARAMGTMVPIGAARSLGSAFLFRNGRLEELPLGSAPPFMNGRMPPMQPIPPMDAAAVPIS